LWFLADTSNAATCSRVAVPGGPSNIRTCIFCEGAKAVNGRKCGGGGGSDIFETDPERPGKAGREGPVG